MALTPEDQALFHHLASQPKSRALLVEQAMATGFKEHPAIRGRSEIEEVMAPLKETISELQGQLDKQRKKDTWERQRSSLRGGEYRFDDPKIEKLEERMKGPDSPVFPEIDSQGRTAYQNAARYFQNLDNPIAPSGVPVSLDMGGHPISDDSEPWRADMDSEDPKVNPLKMSKKQRRLKSRQRWAEASKEYMEKLASRQ